MAKLPDDVTVKFRVGNPKTSSSDWAETLQNATTYVHPVERVRYRDSGALWSAVACLAVWLGLLTLAWWLW
jgi:hypothetical protein